jgi:hypothetical protein
LLHQSHYWVSDSCNCIDPKRRVSAHPGEYGRVSNFRDDSSGGSFVSTGHGELPCGPPLDGLDESNSLTVVKATLLVVVAAIVLALAARYYFTGHQVPAGQPPLVNLTRDSLTALKGDFNRTPDQVRIILLLSPT